MVKHVFWFSSHFSWCQFALMNGSLKSVGGKDKKIYVRCQIFAHHSEYVVQHIEIATLNMQ